MIRNIFGGKSAFDVPSSTQEGPGNHRWVRVEKTRRNFGLHEDVRNLGKEKQQPNTGEGRLWCGLVSKRGPYQTRFTGCEYRPVMKVVRRTRSILKRNTLCWVTVDSEFSHTGTAYHSRPQTLTHVDGVSFVVFFYPKGVPIDLISVGAIAPPYAVCIASGQRRTREVH